MFSANPAYFPTYRGAHHLLDQDPGRTIPLMLQVLGETRQSLLVQLKGFLKVFSSFLG